MTFYRPPLQKIIDRDTSDFEYELGTQAARLPHTPERAFVRAHAGAVHGLYGKLDHTAKNAFPQTAEDAQLVRWASFFGVAQKPARAARGKILISGTAGTLIDSAEARWRRADGTLYRILADHTKTVADFDAVDAVAVEPGAGGNCTSGTTVSLTSPISGINTVATVGVDGMVGGVEVESYNELRTRLLERLANPPSGGGVGSYVAWAKEIEGVTRVWEFGKIPKLGHVTVLFMRDTDSDPFPDALEISEVESKILEYAPGHLAGLHVQAPINKPLILEILLTPNTAEVKAAVIKSIQDMLARKAAPPSVDGVTFYRSWIAEAISQAAGEVDHKLNIPTGDITLNQFELLTLLDPGAQITWV